MSIAIVTDSACDLPQNLVDENHITVVPMYVNIGTKSFRDGVDITREEFYKNLPRYNPFPQTATPSPFDFIKVYKNLAEKGATEILSIHLSPTLSGVMSSAIQAAREFTSIPVTVFDSKQLSLGIGFQALNAAKSAARGFSMQQIIKELENQILNTFSFAALGTLDFLKRSGRMNKTVYMMGNLLSITPILHMHNGVPASDRVLTRRRAFLRMRSYLEKMPKIKIAALMHTHAIQEAQQFWEEVKDILPFGPKLSVEINPVIGAHIGPGAVGLVCITEESPSIMPW